MAVDSCPHTAVDRHFSYLRWRLGCSAGTNMRSPPAARAARFRRPPIETPSPARRLLRPPPAAPFIRVNSRDLLTELTAGIRMYIAAPAAAAKACPARCPRSCSRHRTCAAGSVQSAPPRLAAPSVQAAASARAGAEQDQEAQEQQPEQQLEQQHEQQSEQQQEQQQEQQRPPTCFCASCSFVSLTGQRALPEFRFVLAA